MGKSHSLKHLFRKPPTASSAPISRFVIFRLGLEVDDGEGGKLCAQSSATALAILPFPQKIHPIFSTPSIPVPDSVRSRCRMDRERFEPGGRECPLIWCANVSVSGRGRRWPTRFRWRAALFRVRRAKPATGPGSCFLPAGGVDHRCGPVADMAHLFAPGSVPEHAPKASPAARPGRGRGNPGGGP